MDQIERLVVAARLVTAQGAYLRAAALFGSVEGACRQIRYEPAGPARFDEAFMAGQGLSLEDAFAALPASSSV